MRGVRTVDQVGADERAAALSKRSIKKSSKLWALDLAIRCMDLTTLEGADTPGKVAALCSKAVRPQPGDASIPSVAAVCIYPALVPEAVRHVRGTPVKVASVATAFPSGQSFLDVKLAETTEAVATGADDHQSRGFPPRQYLHLPTLEAFRCALNLLAPQYQVFPLCAA